jgi:hypothetical protein
MIIEAIRAIKLSRYRNFGSDAVAAPEQELVERINVAEAAIDERLRELRDNSNHSEERQSIVRALDALRFLGEMASQVHIITQSTAHPLFCAALSLPALPTVERAMVRNPNPAPSRYARNK